MKRIILGLTLFAGVAGATEVDALLARAQEHAAAGRFAEALPHFSEAAKLAPDNFRTHAGRGAMLNRLDHYAEALAAMDRAVELAPDRPMLRYNRGLALWEIGRHAEAVAEFDRAIAGRPELPMPYADRALAKLCLGDLPGAFADCEKALAADPNYIWARYYRAMAHYTAGEFAKASDDFEAVVAAQPEFTAAHLWHHVASRRTGREPSSGPKLGAGAPWPEPLLAHLRGEMNAETLLGEARRQRVPDDERRVSAAHAVIGLGHLFAKRSELARDSFVAALAMPVPTHFEQVVARAELHRLASDPKARP